MKPLVSVVIPAHNEGAYIGKCLTCVQKAAERIKPQEVEVIVVANRCTDRTAEIARSFGAEGRSVRSSWRTKTSALQQCGMPDVPLRRVSSL